MRVLIITVVPLTPVLHDRPGWQNLAAGGTLALIRVLVPEAPQITQAFFTKDEVIVPSCCRVIFWASCEVQRTRRRGAVDCATVVCSPQNPDAWANRSSPEIDPSYRRQKR